MPLRRCVVLCRVMSSSLSLVLSSLCVVVPCRSLLVECLVNSVNERDLSLLKGFRCGSYLTTSWRVSVQLVLITSQPFVHTARRSCRLSGSAISKYVTVRVTVYFPRSPNGIS